MYFLCLRQGEAARCGFVGLVQCGLLLNVILLPHPKSLPKSVVRVAVSRW